MNANIFPHVVCVLPLVRTRPHLVANTYKTNKQMPQPEKHVKSLWNLFICLKMMVANRNKHALPSSRGWGDARGSQLKRHLRPRSDMMKCLLPWTSAWARRWLHDLFHKGLTSSWARLRFFLLLHAFYKFLRRSNAGSSNAGTTAIN